MNRLMGSIWAYGNNQGLGWSLDKGLVWDKRGDLILVKNLKENGLKVLL